MKKITIFIALIASLSAQAQIDSLVENSEFTGTVLVMKEGKIIYQKGDDQTVYNIASITKTFTGGLIKKLKIPLSDPLSKYYPGYPNGDRITVQHLLTHRSGIPDYVNDPDFKKSDQSKPTTLGNMIAWFKDKPLQFEPGTKFSYSNSGYTLLGYIIEKVTGDSYAHALQNLIFKPIKLRHTSYGPPGDTSHLATGYNMYYKNFKQKAIPVHPSVSYATGAIYGTAADLYKWARSCKPPYTGWFVDTLYGAQRVTHDGNIPGYKSNVNYFPQQDICVIALSNANNSAVGGMVRNIVNILYRQPLSKSFAELPVVDMADSIKTRFTGVYQFAEADSAIVTVQLVNSKLYVKVSGSEPFAIEPVNRNVFRARNTRVEFMQNLVLIYSKGEFLGARKVR